MLLSFKFVFLCVILTTFLIANSDSKRVLGFFPTPSKSHLIIHGAVIEALAKQGHEITVVTSIPWKTKNSQIRHIHLKTVPKFSLDVVTQGSDNPLPWYKKLTQFIESMSDYAENCLSDPAMQKLMKDESFDLVILGYFTNDFLLGVGAHFKCPVVLSFQVRAVGQINDFLGNPQELSYVPSLMGGGTQPMGFVDRVKNFLFVGFIEGVVLNNLINWFQADAYR
ncbi:UDP-glucosyltransferase 2-like [Episyrphus balteatus]|uniref:UDP-glucosyltransferase 2-like n=1 Tax=Episyrphus balteatus TaxID=286459 RepID=UPI002486232C|nr:UDP-glucosyltransferase 2-like [Episyrphus balteatus]